MSTTILLASQSPRRGELLRQLGVRFEQISAEVDERWDGREQPAAHVQRLAVAKAQAGWAAHDSADALLVLAADTIVVVDDDVLG